MLLLYLPLSYAQDLRDLPSPDNVLFKAQIGRPPLSFSTAADALLLARMQIVFVSSRTQVRAKGLSIRESLFREIFIRYPG